MRRIKKTLEFWKKLRGAAGFSRKTSKMLKSEVTILKKSAGAKETAPWPEVTCQKDQDPTKVKSKKREWETGIGGPESE